MAVQAFVVSYVMGYISGSSQPADLFTKHL